MAEAGGRDPRPSQTSCRRNPPLNPKPHFKTSAQGGGSGTDQNQGRQAHNNQPKLLDLLIKLVLRHEAKQKEYQEFKTLHAMEFRSELKTKVGRQCFPKGGSVRVRAGMPEGSAGPLPSQVH